MFEVVFLVFWTLASAGFAVFGIYMLVKPERTTEHFKREGSGLFGDRFANRTYTTSNMRTGAAGFVVGGSFFVIVGVVFLVRTLGS